MEDRGIKVLDLVEHPVFVLEPDGAGRVVYAGMNRFARRMGGWELSDIIGQTALQLYPGRLGEVAYGHHGAVFATGMSRTYELLLTLDGVQRLLRTTLTPEKDGAGRVIRVIGTSSDFTEAKVTAGSGNEANRSEMEDFIKLAAHDLRAPLRQVGMIAGMLREDFQDMGDGKLELIDMLEAVGDKSMRLIGDILTLAQSATDYQGPQVEFELAELVDELMGMLDPMRCCNVDCASVLLRADRTVVQIILRNLIDNAIKHVAGDRSLSLTFQAEEEEPGMIAFRVQDDGGGFDDPAILFLNGGGLKTGSGFGLLGVRRLVHARGGTLGACNLPGGVAEISFGLPGGCTAIAETPRVRRINSRILPIAG